MNYRLLLEPVSIGPKVAKNRVYMSPHSTGFADHGYVTDQYIDYIEERARNNIGIISTGHYLIMANAVNSPGELTTLDSGCVPGMTRLAQAIHRHGVLALAQLNHTGRQADSTYSRSPLFAPSPIPYAVTRQIPKEMNQEDIGAVLGAFARSARYVCEAGFDGIELHASTGYLIEEFLSPYSNKRKDSYGGSLENRCRFLFEVMDALRGAWGRESIILGVKLTVQQRVPGGLTLEDGCQVAQWMEEIKGVDFVHVSEGPYEDRDRTGRGMHTPLGDLVKDAAAVKQRLKRALTVANQRIKYPEQAEQILLDGKADMISMARGLIADAAFVTKVQRGEADSIRLCIGCDQECFGRASRKIPISCLQNPAVGREKEWGEFSLRKTRRPQRIAVIGGGPAGMKVAEIAARRGHHVKIYSADSELGGLVLLAARAPLRGEFAEITTYLAGELTRMGVEINYGHRMSAEDVTALAADTVVLATGSHSVVPDLPGWNSAIPKVSERDVMLGVEVGSHVLFLDLDGHWPGLATAEYLVQMGKRVTFTTPMPVVGVDIPTVGDRIAAMGRLYPLGVRFYPSHSVQRAEGTDVFLVNPLSDLQDRVEGVSTLVYAGNNSSNRELYQALQGRIHSLYAIGDCLIPRRATEAIFEGQRLGTVI